MRAIDADVLNKDILSRSCGEPGCCEECPHFAEDSNGIVRCNILIDQPTLTLNTLRDAVYKDAVAHGLWEEKDFPSDCAWRVKEEAEELCDAGNEWEDEGWYEGEENGNFAEELADVIIMALSTAGHLGIDIDKAVKRKMEFNKTRPWKHGKE